MYIRFGIWEPTLSEMGLWHAKLSIYIFLITDFVLTIFIHIYFLNMFPIFVRSLLGAIEVPRTDWKNIGCAYAFLNMFTIIFRSLLDAI